ncbi:MAG: hypothetical protein JW816_03075 [Candidatus Buchananbacteria bacterium]|nr:hypothetical protein [Candidatus Buchananbacteria bacterium]
MSKRIIFLIIPALFLLGGCQKANDLVSDQPVTQTEAVAKCQQLCQQRLADGINLSAGPCLSEKLLPDWVCDVAHNPRQVVDDNSNNQCQVYRQGAIGHFVEVDQNCKLIKAN